MEYPRRLAGRALMFAVAHQAAALAVNLMLRPYANVHGGLGEGLAFLLSLFVFIPGIALVEYLPADRSAILMYAWLGAVNVAVYTAVYGCILWWRARRREAKCVERFAD